jgi:LEA14-like dessication related protein
MTLHNPAPDAARPASISYEADVDGQTMDRAEGRALTGAPIPARGDGTVAAAVTLPKDFATTWWAASMQGDETTTLRIHGTLSLRRSDGPHDVPFEWRSTWSGTLAKSLSAAVANCSGSGDLCLEQSQFTWAAGRLQAVLVLRNPTPQAVAVGNASVALRLSDHAVVAGNVDLARTIQPGSDAAVSLDLGVQPPGVQAWWPGHVARCETTPVSFAVSLQERPSGSKGVTTLQWTFPAPAFRTRFVCA